MVKAEISKIEMNVAATKYENKKMNKQGTVGFTLIGAVIGGKIT